MDDKGLFLSPEELLTLKSKLQNTIGTTIYGALSGKPTGSLIPVENKNLVVQNPKEMRKPFAKMKSMTTGIFALVAIGILITANAFDPDFDVSTFIVGSAFLVGAFFEYRDYSKFRNLVPILERYPKYLRAFGTLSALSLQELAQFNNVSVEQAAIDIAYYIQKDYFKQARIIDDQVILDTPTYLSYKKLPHTAKASLETNNELNELLHYYDHLHGPVKEDVKRLLLLVEKIYANAKNKPDDLAQIENVKAYYLPSVLKLLSEYELLQDTPNDKAEALKGEIESSIKLINEAFNNLLNDFYDDTAIDIKTDISVLKSLLYKEGLLDRM
ncbi:5-bromo-4-chloroindolyl phosphate hydrolysis family protein [Peptoniphilus equinus]|uniref:5-bromo-4-chloroindolyl phosphate hydrolysis family protein n=1 Tax=Peptoniphilus equinus TaxID=3016343 RepID=A0ABY7QUM7_9FIRM|nr:5-bromo-4-chloroindolyl phosphate hydrolysis family protein [Peptoniphilus equinus]WBW49980.1 5-bromo-4-chloroindolyl phosphate hydrolysis family protein [Peptoniphilus equinus]